MKSSIASAQVYNIYVLDFEQSEGNELTYNHATSNLAIYSHEKSQDKLSGE